MKHVTLVPGALLGALVLLLTGCQTRSISNSGYPGESRGSYHDSFRGELSQLDVVGVAPDKAITEDDIQAALRTPSAARLTSDSRILLIQSGAEFPDAPMLAALKEHYHVAPFSGRPSHKKDDGHDGPSFSKNLRLAAARGGYDKVVCYWGVLESARENHLTSLVSWVPIVGYTIPDKTDHMRIQLKAAIVDVATGSWTIVSPPAAESSKLSTVLSRKESDQSLVQKLKAEGYRSLVQTLREQPAAKVAAAH
ncbi:MAG TPA: hypothetical protein VGE76_12840 [Opitutaceae bacterium]